MKTIWQDLKALKYYYTQTAKGKFELSHYKAFLLLIFLSVVVIDVLIYLLWLRKI